MSKVVPTAADDETLLGLAQTNNDRTAVPVHKRAKQNQPASKTDPHQLKVVAFRTDYCIHVDNKIAMCERYAAPLDNKMLMLIELHRNVWKINYRFNHDCHYCEYVDWPVRAREIHCFIRRHIAWAHLRRLCGCIGPTCQYSCSASM